MKTTRRFIGDCNRLAFDLGQCSPDRGFAQVDTQQDAWYFGTWANPYRLRIVNFAEGDVTIQDAESQDEFASALRTLAEWNATAGYRLPSGKPLGIDPGLNDALRQRFMDLGLGDLVR